jgi:3-hydroxyisobutyrate dehydrogenase-like beta-hydroxyacid dehydrogenase
MIKEISYLGLGTMGSGMASNLLKAGYELTVWDQLLRNANHSAGKARASRKCRQTLSAILILS